MNLNTRRDAYDEDPEVLSGEPGQRFRHLPCTIDQLPLHRRAFEMALQGIKQGPWIRQQDTDPLDNERPQTLNSTTHQRTGAIVICDYHGFIAQEMIKRRPVVVISRVRGRANLCTVSARDY